MSETYVVGVDPGLASFGVAKIELSRDAEMVVDVATIRTAPSAKKRKVLASDDTLRRAMELEGELACWFDGEGVVAIAAESMSFPRIGNQVMVKAVQQLGVAWGLIAAMASARNLPVVQCSPQALKKALTGTASASKDEVRAALERRYGRIEWPRRKADIEHAGDALGAIVACLDSDVIRMARRFAA